MRTQQWDAISGNAVTVLSDVDGFQIILCNPNGLQVVGCSWNNAGSTQGTVVQGPSTPPSGVQIPQGQQVPQVAQATGVRLTLKMADGELVRERELPRWGGT